MQLYSENKSYKLYQGNMLDMLDVIEENSIDSIVTDPPYELGFMGKSWDSSGIAFQKETWEKCLKVLKPGGHLLAFAGSRTQHRIACAIEDAGFEIRDCIMWIYGSGFPKSMNIGLAIDKKNGVESKIVGSGKSGATSRAYQSEETTTAGEYQIKEAQNKFKGFGTQLKPAYEPIIVARKPVENSIVENVMKWGVGGINIDECRVECEPRTIPVNAEEMDIKVNGSIMDGLHRHQQHERVESTLGRFPANLIHDGSEEVISLFPNCKGASSQNNYSNGHIYRGQSLQESSTSLEGHRDWYNDDGSAARFFYCAKASKRDRDEGLEDFENKQGHSKGNGLDRICEFCGVSQLTPELCHCETKSWVAKPKKNMHPTVKPVSLMQYLVRLVSPKGATILDPFNGSGSTGKAAMLENVENNKDYKYIGIELTEEYLPIAKARIEWGYNYIPTSNKKETKKPETKSEYTKISLIDF